MRQQPVPSRQVDDSTATQKSPHASSHLPRFVQLLARQAAGQTHGACESVEERVAREATQIVGRESRSRGNVEGQNSFSAFTPLARIWTPMQRRMNDDKRRKTLMADSPRRRSSRSDHA